MAISPLSSQLKLSGNSTTGVGFMEAKRLDANRLYSAFDLAQAKGILEQTPDAQLLTYRHIQPHHFVKESITLDGSTLPVMALSAPLQAVVSFGKNANDPTFVDPISRPLGTQIAYRFFHGADLDYDPKVLRSVQDALASRAHAFQPAFLVTARIGLGEDPTWEPHINSDSYRPLQDDSQ